MIKLLTGVFFFCSFVVFGQHTLPIQMDTSIINGEISAYGIIDYSGTSIQNQMSEKLIFGGFINADVKDASMDKHRTHNKFGIEISSEIDYKNYNLGEFLKGQYGFYVRAGAGLYGSISYNDDLYGLAFYGNQRYLGDTARFTGTEANLVNFQKIGFGLVSKNLKSSLGVNYFNITDYAEGFVRFGELSADSSGSNMNLDLDARVQMTNSAKFNKGWGIGLDGDFRFKAKWINEREAFFQAQFKNIGLMTINDVDVYAVDSSYSFSGFKYNQLFSDNTKSFDEQEEIMDSLGVKRDTRSVTGFLPGFVQIGKIVDQHSDQNLQSFFGVRLYTTLAYNPLVFGGAEYKFYPWMKVGVQALYGGFAKFRVGFYSQYSVKNFYFAIGSENLIGALTDKGSGQSIHLRLAVKW